MGLDRYKNREKQGKHREKKTEQNRASKQRGKQSKTGDDYNWGKKNSEEIENEILARFVNEKLSESVHVEE